MYGPTDEAGNDCAITLSMFTFNLLRRSLQKRTPLNTERFFFEIKVMSEKALGRGKNSKSDNFSFVLRKSMY